MNLMTPILKDEDSQHLVPSEWRMVLTKIADAIKDEDFNAMRRLDGVRSLSSEREAKIVDSIRRYGAHLAALPNETWNTSMCMWMGDYWDVIVDLYTVEEGASDLVLAVRVYEEGPHYAFDVHYVYVP